jgi:hypothetical protein
MGPERAGVDRDRRGPESCVHARLGMCPAIVDRAALRDAIEALGGDPQLINPLCPDVFGEPRPQQRHPSAEFERSR